MQNDMLNGICHVVNKIFLVASLESRVTQSRGKIIGKTTYNYFISPQHFTCSYYVNDITRKHRNVFIMSLKNEGVAMEICKVVVMSPHYSAVLMGAMASQITSLTIVCSTVYSGADQRKHQSSAVTGEFPAQMASNAENVSIWWRHHDTPTSVLCYAILNTSQVLFPFYIIHYITHKLKKYSEHGADI